METRAPYAVIGLFVVAAIVAVFGFVYWLNNIGGLGERTVYRIRFENSVSGLLRGAAVLFNGIRVGEVTSLRLSSNNPHEVTATIAVAASTPVHADTHVGLDFQGLTGVPVIALEGGTTTPAGWRPSSGEPPLLVADPAAGQSMTQAARDVLRHIDTIVTENSESLRSTIADVNTFAGALARNSGRIDGIAAGLERMTGGVNPKLPTTYDLTAVRNFPTLNKVPRGQLVVAEPTTILMLDTQKILVRPNGSENPSFASAQWSDNVPKLLHARIIQSFENANFLRAVARPNEGVTADFQLAIDIRNFQILTSPDARAVVEFAAKITDNGKIVNARIFQASVPTKAEDAAAAASALDEAFGKTTTELILWASEAL